MIKYFCVQEKDNGNENAAGKMKYRRKRNDKCMQTFVFRDSGE